MAERLEHCDNWWCPVTGSAPVDGNPTRVSNVGVAIGVSEGVRMSMGVDIGVLVGEGGKVPVGVGVGQGVTRLVFLAVGVGVLVGVGVYFLLRPLLGNCHSSGCRVDGPRLCAWAGRVSTGLCRVSLRQAQGYRDGALRPELVELVLFWMLP